MIVDYSSYNQITKYFIAQTNKSIYQHSDYTIPQNATFCSSQSCLGSKLNLLNKQYQLLIRPFVKIIITQSYNRKMILQFIASIQSLENRNILQSKTNIKIQSNKLYLINILMSQFVHVAQFFESTLCFTIPLLIAAQVFAFRQALWEPLDRISEHQYEEDQRWQENQQIYRGSLQNEHIGNEEVPNSVERNIKEQLISPAPDQVEPISDTKEPSMHEVAIEQEKPKSNPQLIQQQIQSHPVDTNEIVVQIANQPAPSNYPIQEKPYLKFYLQVNLIFNEYMPVIMCCVVLGILVESTYILSMFCFFSYLFVNFIFNYAKLFEKLATKTENPLVPQIISNLAGVFLITYFIGIFIRSEYYGV